MPYPPHNFEDFQPGLAFEHGPRRITREDIQAFAALSGDHTALHTDETYASRTSFRGIVAHGALVLAVATGLAYGSGLFDGTVLAITAMTTRFVRPALPGDQVTLRLRVRDLEARPRPDRGRVILEVEVVNQSGAIVLAGDWSLLVRRKPTGVSPRG